MLHIGVVDQIQTQAPYCRCSIMASTVRAPYWRRLPDSNSGSILASTTRFEPRLHIGVDDRIRAHAGKAQRRTSQRRNLEKKEKQKKKHAAKSMPATQPPPTRPNDGRQKCSNEAGRLMLDSKTKRTRGRKGRLFVLVVLLVRHPLSSLVDRQLPSGNGARRRRLCRRRAPSLLS